MTTKTPLKHILCGIFWCITFPFRFATAILLTAVITFLVSTIGLLILIDITHGWACHDKEFDLVAFNTTFKFLRHLWVGYLIYRKDLEENV